MPRSVPVTSPAPVIDQFCGIAETENPGVAASLAAP